MIDRDAREPGQQDDRALVVLGELGRAALFGQVEVAVGLPIDQDRHPEERAHRRMADREPIRVGMATDIGQPQRLRIADQLAEQPAAGRKRSDAAAGRLIDPVGEEAAELGAIRVEYPQRGVAGVGQLPRGVQHTLQHQLHVELLQHHAGDVQNGFVDGIHGGAGRERT